MSEVERELAGHFFEVVRAKRPILGIKEQPSSIVDCHHVLPKGSLRRHHRFRGLEPEQLWEIVWDPDNGVAVERPFHDLLSVAMRRLDISQLRPENIEFARRWDLEAMLIRECPTFPGFGAKQELST